VSDEALDASARVYLRVLAVNVIVAFAAALLVLLQWFEVTRLRALEGSARRVCPREIAAPAPLLVEERDDRMPEDRPTEGYFGANGTQFTGEALLASLERVELGRSRGRAREVQFGDALRHDLVHVVNLWAPWCEPCVEELPRLRALFERRAATWQRVSPVLVKVQDGANPRSAYERIERSVPRGAWLLADRSRDEALTGALRADPERTLYRGDLPVTLLVDCNRRARWAAFTPLDDAVLADLERSIELLLAETREPGKCEKIWCGNGRCDGAEDPQSCPIDCFTAVRVEAPVQVPARPAPMSAERECRRGLVLEAGRCVPEKGKCPEGQVWKIGQCRARCPTGQEFDARGACKPRDPCGDGVCDPFSEGPKTCCADCGCAEHQECREDARGELRCLFKLH